MCTPKSGDAETPRRAGIIRTDHAAGEGAASATGSFFFILIPGEPEGTFLVGVAIMLALR
jgi:hypothetical protein